MIQSDQPLPVTRRCELLKVARSTAYCRPGPVSHEDLVLMRLIDEIHLELPFYGSRRIRDELETRGHPVNRKRVQRLMRHMGVAALYPKRRTSAPGRGHKVYPYLLTGVSVERANQVWATDICYLPMAKGFMYLVAVMIRPCTCRTRRSISACSYKAAALAVSPAANVRAPAAAV